MLDDLRTFLANPARLVRFGTAVAFAMVVAFAVFVVTADGVDALAGGRLGGDWPAFRTAGQLVLEDPASVLDSAAQRAGMRGFLDGNFTPFPYPPLLAYLYAPFALVSFTTGYVLYVLALTAIAVVAIRWTMDVLQVSEHLRGVGMLGALTYTGTFVSIGGAQNTVLTLAVLAGSMRLLAHDRSVAAGLALSLLWFKPQYAVPVLGLVLVTGRVRTTAAAVAGGGLIVLATTLAFGPDWPGAWLELLEVTNAGNLQFNTDASLSPVEWVRGVLTPPWGDALGLAVAATLGAAAVVVARRHRRPDELLALFGIALLLTAPHALFYELALLIPAIGASLHRQGLAWGVAAWVLAIPMPASIPSPARAVYVAAVGFAWYRSLQPLDGAGHASPIPA